MAQFFGTVKQKRPRMYMHPGPPAAVIYMLGQSWFTCRASRGAANTPCPRRRYRPFGRIRVVFIFSY